MSYGSDSKCAGKFRPWRVKNFAKRASRHFGDDIRVSEVPNNPQVVLSRHRMEIEMSAWTRFSKKVSTSSLGCRTALIQSVLESSDPDASKSLQNMQVRRVWADVRASRGHEGSDGHFSDISISIRMHEIRLLGASWPLKGSHVSPEPLDLHISQSF